MRFLRSACGKAELFRRVRKPRFLHTAEKAASMAEKERIRNKLMEYDLRKFLWPKQKKAIYEALLKLENGIKYNKAGKRVRLSPVKEDIRLREKFNINTWPEVYNALSKADSIGFERREALALKKRKK